MHRTRQVFLLQLSTIHLKVVCIKGNVQNKPRQDGTVTGGKGYKEGNELEQVKSE